MAANCPNLGLNLSWRACKPMCCCDNKKLMVKMSTKQKGADNLEEVRKEKLSSLQKISKEPNIDKQLSKIIKSRRRRNEKYQEQSKSKTNPELLLTSSKLDVKKNSLSWFCIQMKSITFLLIIIKCLLTTLADAQCPWTRETAELHSDCICDFNPSQTTNLETTSQHLINRMSVQCSPVNFKQLLKALKQSASIELPRQLLNQSSVINGVQSSLDEGQHIKDAVLKLASQTKLDLLHVSNSSVKLLTDNLFIFDLTNDDESYSQNTENNTIFSAQHFVVAIQSLHLIRCGIEQIQANAFNGLEWSLTSLSLSDNQLETIPVTALRKLINLKVLDLSNNKLFHIKANSFATLNKLNTLRLADNNRLGQLQTLPMTTTTSIIFTSGTIPKSRNNSTTQAIDLQAFVGLEASLSDLNLKNTHLENFPVAIKTLRNLAFLNLAQNQISHIPPRSFEFINSLTAINIERNRISNIENDTFLGVENSLSSLSLLGNLLEKYPVNQLSKLSALRRLDMGFNRIEALPFNSFTSNKQLILIALDGNPLESLPEVTFKPLEGTLRGMSIGGKSLNCDCHLSWMLRWQLEYNLQISSREREPQFCGKPHYLRSLVSFKALKPEHLTCTDQTTTDGVASPNFSQEQFQVSTPPVRQQPVYTVQKANINGIISKNAWAANDPQSNSYSYFTLPAQFTSEPGMTTTTTQGVGSPFWVMNLTTTGNQLSGIDKVSSVMPQAHTVTITSQPETTKLMATTQKSPVIELVEPPEESFKLKTKDDNSLANQEDKQAPPVSFTEYFGTTDLTEASTNEEPTLGNDHVSATTELSVIDQTASAVGQQQRTTGRNGVSGLNNNFPNIASLYGDRTTSNSNSTEPNTYQLGQNGLASLPDDELFVNNNPVTRKTNRHGYLASSPSANVHQRHKSSPIIKTTTTGMIDEIFRSSSSTTKQDQHQARQPSQASSSSADLFRRNNFRGPTTSSTTTTNAPALEPVSSATSVVSSALADSGTRLKPIKSVFGSRAGENGNNNNNNNKREYRQRIPTQLLTQHQSTRSTSSTTSNPPVIPALPTTINVYKMQHQAHVNNQSSHHQSFQSNSPTGSLFKGARFVDDNPLMPVGYPSRASSSPSFKFNQTTGKHTIDQSHLVDSDIERFASTSNVDTRVSNGIQPTKPKLQRVQKDSEWETTTLPTVLPSVVGSINNHQSVQTTPQTTTQASQMFANNTRMSVSSMYRLAINSLRQPSTSTTVAPSLVSQNMTRSMLLASSPPTNLEAAAESETQKMTRTPTIPTEHPTLPFLLTTAHRQFLSHRPSTESKKLSSFNSTSESSPKVALVGSNGLVPTVTQTTHEPRTELKPTISTNSSTELPSTTTRIATTVRFVDSSPPLVRIFSPQSSTVGNTSSVSTGTTTTRPQLITRSPEKVSTHLFILPDTSSKRSVANLASESGPFLVESTTPAIELGKFRVNQADSTIPTTTKRPQQSDFGNNKNTIAVIVGEQQHEARLMLTPSSSSSSSSKTTKPPILHAIGSQVIQPIDQPVTYQEQPTTFSLPNLDTQREFKMKDTSNGHNHQRQGRDDSSAAFVFGGNSQNFLGKLARMADFDQLALILAGLLCFFILILALTIICICYSSWLVGKKRKKNASSSRLTSSFSSSNDVSNRPKSSSNQLSSHYVLKRSLLSRIFCCFCSGKASNKRITPMRSLILQDDDNSSGSSNSDGNGLKATGKSMLLSNPHDSMVSQDLDLLDSIRNASMRASRNIGGRNGTEKQFNLRGGAKHVINNTTGRKPKAKKGRPQSYDDSDCIFASSKPLDHEIGIQRHRQAHEYFIGVAQPHSGKGIGRRRSMVDTCAPNLKSRRDFTGNPSEREAEDGDDERIRNDWIRGDTLSSCDSDKSCSPGANRNNKYNISEAHRAHLRSKNAGQIQARMFVTTSSSSGPQKMSGSSNLLLRTIENDHHNYHTQPDHTGSNMPASDYFDRISRMSSDKSTTDDSRAPLSNTTKNTRSTGGRNLHLGHKQATAARDGTTRTFKASQSQIKRSNSTSNRIQPPLDHNLTPIGGEISVDYTNLDLVPMSAEEQWPEPYIDPADQKVPQTQPLPQSQSQAQQQQQLAQHQPNSAFSSFLNDGSQSQYVQFPKHQATAYEQYQQTSARSQNILSSDSQRRKSRATGHKRSGSGATNQAFTYYDDAYLTNWHTISRSRQCAGYSARDADVLMANEPAMVNNYPEPLANNQSTLIRYRSIPSLNGFSQNNNPQQSSNSSNQLLSSQIGGATNWLRWTPTSFMNQRDLIDSNNNDNVNVATHKHSKNLNELGTDTNKSRSQNNVQVSQQQQVVMNGWHRDNFVEAVYVAANQQR